MRNARRRSGKTQAGRPDTEAGAARHRTESWPAARRLGGSAARRLGGSAARRLGGSAARRLGGSADIIDRALSAIVNPPSGLFSGECSGPAAAPSPTPYPPVSPLMAVSTRRRRPSAHGTHAPTRAETRMPAHLSILHVYQTPVHFESGGAWDVGIGVDSPHPFSSALTTRAGISCLSIAGPSSPRSPSLAPAMDAPLLRSPSSVAPASACRSSSASTASCRAPGHRGVSADSTCVPTNLSVSDIFLSLLRLAARRAETA